MADRHSRPAFSVDPEAGAQAARAQRRLAAHLVARSATQCIQIVDAHGKPHAVQLPTPALRLLMDALGELAAGNAVQVVPMHAELSTQQAADLLKVSRPHFVKLLEDGVLPFHRTGRHRRVRFADLMHYLSKRDSRSEWALQRPEQMSQMVKSRELKSRDLKAPAVSGAVTPMPGPIRYEPS